MRASDRQRFFVEQGGNFTHEPLRTIAARPVSAFATTFRFL
jgi:hypothetical protein